MKGVQGTERKATGARHRAVLFVVFLAMVVAALPRAPVAGAASNEAVVSAIPNRNWPMERHNLARTGFNADETELIPPLGIKWKAPASRGSTWPGIISEGGYVFTLDSLDTIAYDLVDGSEVWRFDDGEWPRAARDGRAFMYGHTIGGKMFATDLDDGNLLWTRSGLDCHAGASCPFGLGFDDNAVVNGIYGVSEATGETLWATGSLFDCGGDEFAIADGRYFVSDFRVGGRTLRACDIESGAIAWETEIDTNQSGHRWPVVSGNRVVFMGLDTHPDRTFVYSVRASDGGDLQEYSFLSHSLGSPAVAYDTIYVGAEDGILRAIDLETMSLAWSKTLLGPIGSSPAVANGVVYVTTAFDGDTARVYGVNADNGTILWQADVPDRATYTPSPIIAGGQLLLVSDGVGGQGVIAFGPVTPVDVVVLGGPSAVSDAVFDRLASCTTGTVTRIAGRTRYETAAAISEATFAHGASVAYVATGENYPDALTGGAAAGSVASPVLLTGRDSLPAPTAAELARLDPDLIVVLGGTAAVSTAVEGSLGVFAPAVRRVSGANRYATGAAVSRDAFPLGATTAFVATGENFPDALAGGPPAIQAAGPVLLVSRDSIPSPVANELVRLGVDDIKVLGGRSAVSDTVAGQLGAFASHVTRYAGSNRYATAATVARAHFASGVSRVYVATGEDFPDALAGTPAAGLMGAPILLVSRDNLPASTENEIERLTGTACASA